jgi:hypothetical protein
LLAFAVERVTGNRENGLLREIAEVIESCDDPEQLRRFGQSLKMLSDASRSKGLHHGGKLF